MALSSACSLESAKTNILTKAFLPNPYPLSGVDMDSKTNRNGFILSVTAAKKIPRLLKAELFRLRVKLLALSILTGAAGFVNFFMIMV